MCVLHHCDNRPCCNPAHLWLGTRKDNIQDMLRKGRARPKYGIAHPRAKLNEHNVRTIRQMHATGHYNKAKLARLYGVSQTAIASILAGRAWKHVE